MGIRRAQRLRSRSEFAAVYQGGKPFRGRLVILRALRTNGPVSRFGFTTGKALGGAVVRNRTRRRLREIVRALPIESGWDIVLNARSTAPSATFRELSEDVASLMTKAGALS